jgi:hypothetical protein
MGHKIPVANVEIPPPPLAREAFCHSVYTSSVTLQQHIEEPGTLQ